MIVQSLHQLAKALAQRFIYLMSHQIGLLYTPSIMEDFIGVAYVEIFHRAKFKN